MARTLRVAVAQPRCVSFDVAGNAARHGDLVRRAEADVVVFPELSLTGYELAAAPLAPGDPRLFPLMSACAEVGAVALAGAPVSAESGRRHIGTLAVDGVGVRVVYHKMWLGGAEPGYVSPGRRPGVAEVGGLRLGQAICKDTGVPEHASATAALGIDAYVAGSVEHAADADVLGRRAARITGELGVPVAIAAMAGPTGGGFDVTSGRSGIWRADGRSLATAGPDPDTFASAALVWP